MEGTPEQPPEAPEGPETRGAGAKTEPQVSAPIPWTAEPSPEHDAVDRTVGRQKPACRPTTASWHPCPSTVDQPSVKSKQGADGLELSRTGRWSPANDEGAPETPENRGSIPTPELEIGD